MNREIKFRARRFDNGRWIYGQYFTTPLTDENSGTNPDAGWFFLTGITRHCIVQNCVAFVIDPKTLGQYTGLKDKNGVEIYEGDIISARLASNTAGFTGYVHYLNAQYWVNYIGYESYYQALIYLHGAEYEPIEVIGNTYENTDLLKG